MKRSTSRLLSTLLVLCMVLALLPGTVWGAISGKCGDNMTWSLSSGTYGILTIQGTGSMDIDVLSIPWYDYRKQIYLVEIGEGVTNIGEYAFWDCSNLRTVVIPDSVTSIGNFAFTNCSNLIRLEIPKSVTTIGESVFPGCSNLVGLDVAIGNPAYTSVDGVLFSADKTLLHTYPAGKSDKSYSIPASVTTLGRNAFYGSASLTGVTIPNSVTTIGVEAFSGSGLTSVTIPDDITAIANFTFNNCKNLTSVTLPGSITVIGKGAFDKCTRLTDVYYSGSQEQLQQINFGEDNDPLLNSILHYITPAPVTTTPDPTLAYASTQTVELDGKPVEFQMYALKDANGNDTNYIKVRDLAMALKGTEAEFSVDWDGAVKLVAGETYTPNGSENATPFSGNRGYTIPTDPTNVNGAASGLEAILLKDDAGGGFTYYKLRDLGSALGFNVSWSAERGVFIETDKPYAG